MKQEMKMTSRWKWILMGLLLMFSTAALAESVIVPGKWLVELEAAPALEYEGDQNIVLRAADGSLSHKALAATSPEATGQSRYDAHAPAVQAYVRWLDTERAHVLDLLSMDLGRTVETNRVFHHVFNGFEASLSDEEAARIAELPGVRSVRPVLAHRLMLDAGPELIGATALHAGTGNLPANGGEGTVIGIIDSGINWEHPYFSDAPLPSGHVFSNPYSQPLGECSKPDVGCNEKLVGIYNFADEGTDGKDPQGHGTHVASTAAGVPLRLSFSSTGNYTYHTTGVAPHANIISYKVCYDKHPTDEELDERCESGAIRQAWEQAVIDGVDVVNYSVGSDANNPWTSGSRELLNLWSAGIPFVTSAGNSGPGRSSLGSPADAPWAFAIGASTHTRLSGKSATIAGLTNRILIYGDGPGLTTNLTAPLVAADTLAGNDLGCGAFPDGALSGSIALIQRGDCSFEDKVRHAAQAGASAVLVYNSVHGAPIRMGGLTTSTIPAAMMSRGDGLQVRERLAQAGAHSATLRTTDTARKDLEWADFMADFSGRGPAAFVPGVMKPNVVAPGVDVLAGYFRGSNSYAFMNGTSMASPHAAGAVALLKSLHPSWTPAMLQSALETTAELADVYWDDGPASALDRGNGRIRVDKAARAGLYLPVTRAEFEAAYPAQGGNPSELNLAGIWSESCMPDCSFTRTVQAHGPGKWRVRTVGDLDISVSPQVFTLGAGQKQKLNIQISSGSSPAGSLAESHIELIPEQGDYETQRLRAAIQVTGVELPSVLQFDVDSNRGRRTRMVKVGPLPEAVYQSSELVRPKRESFKLAQDASRNNPFAGSIGRRTFLVDVPEGAMMLMAQVVSSSARDIDLYVGRDLNGNGVAEESELVCQSTVYGPEESCYLKFPAPGRWWVLVQNWEASSFGAEDPVELDIAVLEPSDDHSFVVSGAGRHPGGDLELSFSWDAPGMFQNEPRVAAMSISTSPDRLGDLGVVPVRITRTTRNLPKPTALFVGEGRHVVLPGSAKHDLLYVDVPGTATSLEITIQGQDGVGGSLYRLPFADIAGHAPGTPPAPVAGVLDTGNGSGSGFKLTQAASSGQYLEAGRYYIVLKNSDTRERRVSVRVRMEERNGDAANFGLWNPRGREIYQGFDWGLGLAGSTRVGSILWYSYDANGLPVFYNAVDTLRDGRSTWSTRLLRTTSIGNRNNIFTVGEFAVTSLGPSDMIVAWRLDGAHGSERLIPGHSQVCAQPGVNYNGHWYSPGVAEGGTTMIITDAAQAQIRYYFDELGVGRWVITDDNAGLGPLGEELSVLDVRGFCPNCEEGPVSFERVGSYARIFHSETRATEIIEFNSAAPLNGHYEAELEIERLTAPLECE